MSNEKHWSDDLERWAITEMQTNRCPFCLCEQWMKDALKAAAKSGDVDKLSVWGHWESRDILAGDMSPSRTYRLRQNFKRPEKEREKKGRWEVCGIVAKVDDFYWFVREGNDCALHEAPGMVGYVRNCIEYEGWPGKWLQMGAMKTLYGLADNAPYEDDSGPATPKRVRFWIEE